jgi:hypothetical protein
MGTNSKGGIAMNRREKIGLIFFFTVLFSIFIYQGWYEPKTAQANTDTYTTAGTYTWTAPAGVTSVTVETWAGGGGGGGVALGWGGSAADAGGGGGGQYSSSVVTVVPGNNYQVVVGAGGAAGSNAGGPGGTGGNSTFATTTVVATGGSGGGGVTSNNGAGTAGAGGSGGTGTTKYNGGNGAAGGASGALTGGAGGGGAGSTGAGGNASGTTAGTGTANGGGNGGAGRTTAGAGNAGLQEGGGGSGAGTTSTTAYAGGAGADGQVSISWNTCTRSAPTVSISPASQNVGQGLTSGNYTLTVTNNDSASCAASTFNLAWTNTAAIPNSDFSSVTGESATIGPINAGSPLTLTFTHTAAVAAVVGHTEQTFVAASDANHAAVTSNTVTSTVTSSPPTLTSGAMNPPSGDTTQTYNFTVVYTNSANIAPAAGYPKIYIGDADGYFSYPMSLDTSAAAALHDGNYANGEQYVYTADLGAARDIRFYFEAKAATGNTTIVTLPSGAPGTYSTAPAQYLLYAQNMVGVPKDLTLGYSYTTVLGGDSGYSWCQTYNSTGLYTGVYVDCKSSNIVQGKGYWIWAVLGNWNMGEPAGVSNDAGASHDVPLQVGWNMVSNPYNERIPLQSASGPRCTVVRNGVESADFNAAVVSGYVSGTIYEWQGPTTGYFGTIYNGTPPAVMSPWKGYWFFVSDTTFTTMTLRVYK